MGKVVVTCNEVIVDSILGTPLSDFVGVGKKLRYEDAYDWTSDPQDLDIPPRYVIQGMIDAGGGGGSSNVLEFTLTTDSNGDIDLSGQTGMPVAGTLASAKAAYDGDTDYSQSLTYNPTTQVLSTGANSTVLNILMTFGTPLVANDPPTNGIVDDENRTFTFTEPI